MTDAHSHETLSSLLEEWIFLATPGDLKWLLNELEAIRRQPGASEALMEVCGDWSDGTNGGDLLA